MADFCLNIFHLFATLRWGSGLGFSTPSLTSETPYENPLEGTPFFIFIVFNNMHFFL